MNKYRNKKVSITFNGERYQFDSKKEASHFNVLKDRLMAGEISQLSIHPSFLLQAGFKDFQGKKVRSISYEADFKYFDIRENKWVIEDCKGFRTVAYKLKRKLFLKILPENTVFFEL